MMYFGPAVRANKEEGFEFEVRVKGITVWPLSDELTHNVLSYHNLCVTRAIDVDSSGLAMNRDRPL